MAGGPAPYRKHNPAERAELAAIIFDLKLQGLSFRGIEAATLAPDGPTAGKRVAYATARDLVREEVARRVDPLVNEYRTIELARLEATLERLHNMEESVRRVMARKHITVSNGKVITLPGEDEPLEDDGFILQAVDRLTRIEESRRRTSESLRRLLGLDMPVKVDATVTEVTQEDIELSELIREAEAKNAVEEARIKGETG